MIQRNFLIVLVFSLFFSGCATTDEKRSDLNSGENNLHLAGQTVNYSVDWVDEATRGVLDKMDIMITGDSSHPEKKSIKAATIDQDILIEFLSLTPTSTRMNINIQSPDRQKTKTTANEIFYQTRQFLLANKRPKTNAQELNR